MGKVSPAISSLGPQGPTIHHSFTAEASYMAPGDGTGLYCAVLHYVVLHYAVLCCTVLYCAALCCAVLYCASSLTNWPGARYHTNRHSGPFLVLVPSWTTLQYSAVQHPYSRVQSSGVEFAPRDTACDAQWMDSSRRKRAGVRTVR